jgi:hypothetical protein
MPHRPYGQNMGYMWQQKSYQEWEQLHLEGALNPTQDRFWDPKPAEELYDIDRDPDCVDNLADSPRGRHRSALRQLRGVLHQHLLATNDNGFIPESHPAEGYLPSRAPGAYPIRRVLAVADLAIRREPDNLGALLAHLRDDNDIVRFWAAQGLLMLGDRASAAVQALAGALSTDPSVYVKIPVAEALARMGHTANSVKFLAATLDEHPNNRVRLQALNALTWVGTAALPYKAVVDRAAVSTDEYIKNAGRYLKFVLDGTYTPQTPIYVP